MSWRERTQLIVTNETRTREALRFWAVPAQWPLSAGGSSWRCVTSTGFDPQFGTGCGSPRMGFTADLC